jgi:hypothetical protein
MAINGLVKWEAGGISDAITNGFIETEVHRSITGIDGVYSEITGVGTRVTLVAGTEAYSWTDVTAELTYYYKMRHRSAAGKNSGFSNAIGFVSAGLTEIDDLWVKAAYVSPDDFQGQWVKFDPLSVNLTREQFNQDGNRPYTIGTDWSCKFLLGYDDTTTGYEEGHSLAGATVNVKIYDHGGTLLVTKTNGSGITLANQGVKQSLDGTMGEFTMAFLDTESTLYVARMHSIVCDVTFSDSDIGRHFEGRMHFGGTT